MLVPTLVAALLTATAPVRPSAPRDAPVVRVSGGDRFGAGVVWDAPEGLVLTALHVVEGLPELRVSVGGAPAVAARIVDVDPSLDLALIATEPLGAAGSERAAAAAACGARVRLLGHPRGGGGEVGGLVVDPARRFAGARYVEIGLRAEPGASGGPVVDASGAVVGIVDLVLADGDRTLAIPIDAAIARFPRRARGVTADPAPSVAVAGVGGATPARRARAD